MSRDRREGVEPDAEDERLKRPKDEVKDLESPQDESDEVRGGSIKQDIELK
jgi:hypothetical protein